MKILDKLPIGEQPAVLFVGTELVTIKRYQIAVWISINDPSRPFPAVLDKEVPSGRSPPREEAEPAQPEPAGPNGPG